MRRLPVLVVGVLVSTGAWAGAQAPAAGAQAPPPMTNLQIIPKDTPRPQVLQQMQAIAAALGVQGSGWAALVYDSIGQRPIIVQFHDQQQDFPVGVVPLLLLDVWEHAYYLDYANVRADYVKAFWNIVNWANVEQRLTTAREKTAGLLLPS